MRGLLKVVFCLLDCLLCVDDLSKQLSYARSGCFIGHQCINHVMYVDDICLLDPSALWLQKLLEMWQTLVKIMTLFLTL